MKKTNRQINLFDISKIENKSSRSDKIRTTDINILLNRVRHEKKRERKENLLFLGLIGSVIVVTGIIASL